MILGKNEILKLIKRKKIEIQPLNINNIGPASIDLELENIFRIFKKKENIVLDKNTDYKKHSKIIKGPLKLKPGDFVLGITKEKIKLPENICGLLNGRTKYARMGILIHATASLIHPGVHNKQVLEIKNISQNTITLKKGLKLCQLSLIKMKGKGKYTGKANNQTL